MAMTMTGEFVLPADKATVWARLNDPETLKASIPGCETLEKLSDTDFQAVVKVKIGPVSARFNGKVHLTDIQAPDSYRIAGEGEGGVAGFAKGGATVRLADADGGGTKPATTWTRRSGGEDRPARLTADRRFRAQACRRVLRQLRQGAAGLRQVRLRTGQQSGLRE
jgi:carbon monoxide dehydrogenase subunit G